VEVADRFHLRTFEKPILSRLKMESMPSQVNRDSDKQFIILIEILQGTEVDVDLLILVMWTE
jgi:hypothetical protein